MGEKGEERRGREGKEKGEEREERGGKRDGKGGLDILS
jgi:hypothetical protein